MRTGEDGGAAREDDLLEEGLAQVQVRLHDAPHQALLHACTAAVYAWRERMSVNESVSLVDAAPLKCMPPVRTLLLAPDELRAEEDLGRAEAFGANLQQACCSRKGWLRIGVGTGMVTWGSGTDGRAYVEGGAVGEAVGLRVRRVLLLLLGAVGHVALLLLHLH